MGSFRDAAVDDAIGRRVEILGEKIGQDRRDARPNLGWFENGRTSGTDGANNRLEAQKNGVVPGPVRRVRVRGNGGDIAETRVG